MRYDECDALAIKLEKPTYTLIYHLFFGQNSSELRFMPNPRGQSAKMET